MIINRTMLYLSLVNKPAVTGRSSWTAWEQTLLIRSSVYQLDPAHPFPRYSLNFSPFELWNFFLTAGAEHCSGCFMNFALSCGLFSSSLCASSVARASTNIATQQQRLVITTSQETRINQPAWTQQWTAREEESMTFKLAHRPTDDGIRSWQIEMSSSQQSFGGSGRREIKFPRSFSND